MGRLQTHVRNKFVAGVLAAIPVAVTFFVLWYVDSKARSILRIDVPFLGIAIALGAIYLLGLFVTSVVGRFLIGITDWILGHVPGLRDLYRAWKQVALTDAHDGAFGIFGRVVLVPDEAGRGMVIGFTSGHAVEGDPEICCVFIPASPNPTSGRLHFIPQSRCIRVDLAPQEAIKMIISGGNYLPRAIGAATAGAPR
ncbi:MAG TPA: DUF502 domain-containing protein [Polyangia bacterium]|jgi:uncharacterized membrane protein|nr:DUF502 domain-containing protein [Polyangia bacterium]